MGKLNVIEMPFPVKGEGVENSRLSRFWLIAGYFLGFLPILVLSSDFRAR